MRIKKIVIADGAIRQLPGILKELGASTKVLLVADTNTYQAAGRMVAHILTGAAFTLQECILRRQGQLAADEEALVEVLLNIEPDTELILAVGAGTINDIARYTSYKTGKPYAIVATAPSMDGYASSVAALTIKGCKKTCGATPPVAIIGDVDILAVAPRAMILAGLGDILGKYTSLADWKLSNIITGEGYSDRIADEVRGTVNECVRLTGSQMDKRAVQSLMQALVTSGLAMLEWGNSRPASGSEHHISHFLEMHDILAGTGGHLHGAKVGIAEIMVTELYHRVFKRRLEEIKEFIDRRQPETSAVYRRRVTEAYGPLAEEVIHEVQGYYLDEARRRERQRNILQTWEDMQLWVRQNVPPPEEVRDLLLKAGAPTSFAELGIPAARVRAALENAKEVRQRYTIFRLIEDIGMARE